MKCFSFIFVLTFFSMSFAICNDYSFDYAKKKFSICSRKKSDVELVQIEKIKIYNYGRMMFVVGLPDDLQSFFIKSGFKLKKGSINDTRYLCEYSQKKMIATDFDYMEDLRFGFANIPNDVKYSEKEIVFSIYREGEERGIKKSKGKGKVIMFR